MLLLEVNLLIIPELPEVTFWTTGALLTFSFAISYRWSLMSSAPSKTIPAAANLTYLFLTVKPTREPAAILAKPVEKIIGFFNFDNFSIKGIWLISGDAIF